MGIISFFISQRLFINLQSVFLIFLGYYSLSTINRERFPIVDLDIMVVTAVYPGAAPVEMEELVTSRIEDELLSADGIHELQSYAVDSRSDTIIWLDDDLEDTRAAMYQSRRLIDGIREFPSDMERPLITEITSRKRPIGSIVLAATDPGVSFRELRETAKILADELQDLRGIAEITRSDWRDREFRVELQPGALRSYNIGVDQVLAAISNRNTTLPVGRVVEDGREIILKTPGKIRSSEELGNLVVRANETGFGVKLSQLARIVDDFEEVRTLSRVNGQPAQALVILKKRNFDTIRTTARVQSHLDEFLGQGDRAGKYSAQIIDNAALRIGTRLDVLTSNATIGITLVLITLFFFLNWRIAVITAVGIPLAFACTFVAMQFLGYNLDLLTLIGLIVVVGMELDDAIIVDENLYRQQEAGLSTVDAAVRGTSEVILPVAATILTSIAAFTPLLIMQGTQGKFAFFIAIVIILALISSWLESMFALPAHVADFAKVEQEKGALRQRIDRTFTRWREVYQRVLLFTLRFRGEAIALMSVAFGAAFTMIYTGFIPFVAFPQAGIDSFMLSCRAPQGTVLEETSRRRGRLEALVELQIPRLRDPALP